MKKFDESRGQLQQRIKTQGARKPLRSFKELCDECGVSQREMTGKLRRQDAPTPRLVNNGKNTGRNSWYEPTEFRKWWASIKEAA